MRATIASYKYVKFWIGEILGSDKEDFCGGWCASGLYMDALIEEKQKPSEIRAYYIEAMINNIIRYELIMEARQDKKLWNILKKYDWESKL